MINRHYTHYPDGEVTGGGVRFVVGVTACWRHYYWAVRIRLSSKTVFLGNRMAFRVLLALFSGQTARTTEFALVPLAKGFETRMSRGQLAVAMIG